MRESTKINSIHLSQLNSTSTSILAYLHNNKFSSPDLRLISAELRFLQIFNLPIFFNLIWAAALNSARYIDFKRPKSWKNYVWNSPATKNRDLRPNCALDKKVEENRPPFFREKNGVCFLQLFIWGMVCCCMAISHVYFSRLGLLKVKFSDKNVQCQHPFRIFYHMGFKKVNFDSLISLNNFKKKVTFKEEQGKLIQKKNTSDFNILWQILDNKWKSPIYHHLSRVI